MGNKYKYSWQPCASFNYFPFYVQDVDRLFTVLALSLISSIRALQILFNNMSSQLSLQAFFFLFFFAWIMVSKSLLGVWVALDILLLAAGIVTLALSIVWRGPNILTNMVLSTADLNGTILLPDETRKKA